MYLITRRMNTPLFIWEWRDNSGDDGKMENQLGQFAYSIIIKRPFKNTRADETVALETFLFSNFLKQIARKNRNRVSIGRYVHNVFKARRYFWGIDSSRSFAFFS